MAEMLTRAECDARYIRGTHTALGIFSMLHSLSGSFDAIARAFRTQRRTHTSVFVNEIMFVIVFAGLICQQAHRARMIL